MVGILPTLRERDTTEDAMSPNPRYCLLNEQMCAARGEEMRIAIEGPERLLTHVDSIMPEAACTSVQLHLQVSPEAFGNYWNAAQAVAGIQVALGANSPYLYGKELWRETRIPLFQQATDTRPEELQVQGCGRGSGSASAGSPRCSTCSRRTCATSLAAAAAATPSDPVAELESGATPELAELTLHNGTVYRWNRPVYAVDDGEPHLRVENRVLPARPDRHRHHRQRRLLLRPGQHARRGGAADLDPDVVRRRPRQPDGGRPARIEASVYWPGLGEVPVAELTLRRLLPLAREGLQRWQVDRSQADRMLAVIEERCLTGRTGATWQTETVHRLQGRSGLDREHGAAGDDPALPGPDADGRSGAHLAGGLSAEPPRDGQPLRCWGNTSDTRQNGS